MSDSSPKSRLPAAPRLTLHQAIRKLHPVSIHGSPATTFRGLTADSRCVKPGNIFIAIRGNTVDGHRFIQQSIAAGAVAIIADTPAPPSLVAHNATWIQVRNTAKALGALSSMVYGDPSRKMQLLAVTGTNGKTTVAHILYQLLTRTGFMTGFLGTTGYRYHRSSGLTNFTTPPPPRLQSILRAMHLSGMSHVSMEVSSHALSQERLHGIKIAVAGFTNLSRDHLDYHRSMESYGHAKARLFNDYAASACFNLDDPFGNELAEGCSLPSLTVSARGNSKANLYLSKLHVDISGSHAILRGIPDFEGLGISTGLVGPFNMENIIVALGMGYLAGGNPRLMVDALPDVTGAPGRLERVHGDPHIFVDYAHSPDALRNVLQTLNSMKKGRLICVFGAGGNRDIGKRPLMGETAASLADIVIVTSDNPRTEEPSRIIEDILAGANSASRFGKIHVEPDRRRAICLGVELATRDDILLLAGKGHENYQETATGRVHFDDREEIRKAIAIL